MPAITFEQMPDDARVWIFAADRPLKETERARLLEQTDQFLGGWAAHGTPLTNARDLRYDQFLIIAADEKAAGASGCSIDAMVRNLRGLEQDLGVTLIDHAAVQFRDNGAIRRVERPEFSRLAAEGTVGPETTVFNNTVPTVGDLRSGRWETPAAQSWHAEAFFQG